MEFISSFLHWHPSFNLFIHKVMQDNITFLASAVAWTLLTSVVPIVVGLVAISSLFFHDPSSQRAVVDHLSTALQGTLQPQDIRQLVTTSIRHRGVLALIGVVGILWAGSNVGGVFSTVFQPVFEVNGRDFHKRPSASLRPSCSSSSSISSSPMSSRDSRWHMSGEDHWSRRSCSRF